MNCYPILTLGNLADKDESNGIKSSTPAIVIIDGRSSTFEISIGITLYVENTVCKNTSATTCSLLSSAKSYSSQKISWASEIR